jgi:zinc protease
MQGILLAFALEISIAKAFSEDELDSLSGIAITAIEEISKEVKVVALSRKFLHSASIVFLIGRGSYDDPVEGCACLSNRMRLKLTSTLSPLELQAFIDQLGATVDAVTYRDVMFLRAQVTPKRVKECLGFLAELFTSPRFPVAEVAKEKTSQKIEYEKIRQDPMTASVEDAWEATFPMSPLGHPVTGYPETIEKLTPQTLEKFDADTVKKAPLVIGIVGPQDEKKLIDLAISSFSGIGKNRQQPRSFALRRRRDFNIVTRPLEVKQTTFSLGMITSGVSSSEYPTLLLIEDYLGSDRRYTGVLFRELREKRGLTYFAHSRLSAFRDHGLLTAFAGVEHKKVLEALSLMLESIVQLRDKLVPEKEIKEIRTFHKRAVRMALEAPSQAATWLAGNVYRGGEVDFASYFSKIDAVSSEAVRRVAGEFLVPSHMSLSVAGKPPEEESLMDMLKETVE